MQAMQVDMFRVVPKLPDGFRYEPDLITAGEEASLLQHISELPFTEFQFQGFVGKRRTVSYGWHYDFNQRLLKSTYDIPEFLLPLRETAARFADIAPDALQQVLVTEYASGAGIGWHRDKAVFGDVIGISLRAPAMFRLRRKLDEKWQRVSLTAEPRSVYLLRGPSRTEWEHSIPGVDELRYSVTFRNLKGVEHLGLASQARLI